MFVGSQDSALDRTEQSTLNVHASQIVLSTAPADVAPSETSASMVTQQIFTTHASAVSSQIGNMQSSVSGASQSKFGLEESTQLDLNPIPSETVLTIMSSSSSSSTIDNDNVLSYSEGDFVTSQSYAQSPSESQLMISEHSDVMKPSTLVQVTSQTSDEYMSGVEPSHTGSLQMSTVQDMESFAVSKDLTGTSHIQLQSEVIVSEVNPTSAMPSSELPSVQESNIGSGALSSMSTTQIDDTAIFVGAVSQTSAAISASFTESPRDTIVVDSAMTSETHHIIMRSPANYISSLVPSHVQQEITHSIPAVMDTGINSVTMVSPYYSNFPESHSVMSSSSTTSLTTELASPSTSIDYFPSSSTTMSIGMNTTIGDTEPSSSIPADSERMESSATMTTAIEMSSDVTTSDISSEITMTSEFSTQVGSSGSMITPAYSQDVDSSVTTYSSDIQFSTSVDISARTTISSEFQSEDVISATMSTMDVLSTRTPDLSTTTKVFTITQDQTTLATTTTPVINLEILLLMDGDCQIVMATTESKERFVKKVTVGQQTPSLDV